MYDKLVKELRDCRNKAVFSEYRWEITTEAADAIEELTGFVQEAERDRDEYRERLDKANDAIEELSRMEQDFRQYISDQVNREKGVYACCYCKHRESTNKYEPGCTLEKCDGVSGWAWGVPKEE